MSTTSTLVYKDNIHIYKDGEGSIWLELNGEDVKFRAEPKHISVCLSPQAIEEIAKICPVKNRKQ